MVNGCRKVRPGPPCIVKARLTLSSLTSGAFLLPFGRIADLFGRKSMVIASFTFYAVFALACGFAKTPITLDALNGLLGLCGAAAVPPAVGLLGTIYEQPSQRKNAAFACFSAGNPVGFAIGMVFGGIATQLFGWPACYWLLAIIYAVLAVTSIFCLPIDTVPKRPLNSETFKNLDPVGALLIIVGVGMFSAALSLGATAPQGWKTGYVLALLIVGLVLIVAFVFWELWYPHPLVPLKIFKDRNFSLLNGIVLLGFLAFPPACFYIALFFQRVWKYSAVSTAVHLLPMAISGIFVNIFAGLVLHRISNKMLMLAGAAAYTVSCLLFAVNKESSSYWAFCMPALVLIVVGADLEFNVANMYVMQSLPKEQASIAGAILQTVTRLFTTVGYGVVTAVYSSVATDPHMGGYYKDEPQTQPYSAAFFFTTACAALGVGLVPFLTIGTQGGHEKDEPHDEL